MFHTEGGEGVLLVLPRKSVAGGLGFWVALRPSPAPAPCHTPRPVPLGCLAELGGQEKGTELSYQNACPTGPGLLSRPSENPVEILVGI